MKKQFSHSRFHGFHSLRARLSLLLCCMFVLFCALVLYNNMAAFRLLLDRMHNNTEDTLVLYQKALDEDLERTETYLYTFALGNTDLIALKTTPPTSSSWYPTLYRIRENFKSALPTYTADGFFCYAEFNKQLVMYDSDYSPSPAMRATVREILEDDDLDLRSWFLHEINGRYYLVRILNLSGYKLGAYVALNTLLDTLVRNGESDSLLYFTDGTMVLRTPSNSFFLNPRNTSGAYLSCEFDDDSWLAISQPLDHTSLSLSLFLSASEYTRSRTDFYSIALVVALFLLVIWFSLFTSLYKWVLHPVARLTRALEQLRSGNLDIRIAETHQLDEFQNMTDTFNEMVSEIKDLKIDVYEKQLARQKLEALYLKQQITPHFMINCLNTVYQLTEINQPELAQKMIKDLSSHLRYTLSSGQTVAFSEELKLVRNYIDLSSIRYPNALKLILSCDAQYENATVVPLLLLTFVENTVKYEVVMGKILEIHIEITPVFKNNCTYLHVCLWDSGKGFSSDVLPLLEDFETYATEETEHIGIVNVVLRMRPIFPDVSFTFCNRKNAGAQIDIEFPYVPFFPVS